MIHNAIVPISSPEVSKVPIIECQERLIDLKNQQKIYYGERPPHSHENEYTKIRESVYVKLVDAQTLLPKGLSFSVLEGYRSLKVQKELFEKRLNNLRLLYPSWDAKELFCETVKLVSPTIEWDGQQNIPPHSTGGAIDIILVDENGDPVPMGIHPAQSSEDTFGTLCATQSTMISSEASEYRTLMCNILDEIGFVNYPTEYWHWSYGDRYHAFHMNLSHAIYGDINNLCID